MPLQWQRYYKVPTFQAQQWFLLLCERHSDCENTQWQIYDMSYIPRLFFTVAKSSSCTKWILHREREWAFCTISSHLRFSVYAIKVSQYRRGKSARAIEREQCIRIENNPACNTLKFGNWATHTHTHKRTLGLIYALSLLLLLLLPPPPPSLFPCVKKQTSIIEKGTRRKLSQAENILYTFPSI